jgi:thioredoxin reductase (NADPH)
VNENGVVDITILGAGPAGLAAAYYAGHRDASVRIIESLEQPGGQVAAVYPEKHVYDVAGHPKILGTKLVELCAEQGLQYGPDVRLGEEVQTLERLSQNGEEVLAIGTDTGGPYLTRALIITAGHGAFEPRKLGIEGIDDWEGKGVHYFVREKDVFRDRTCVIVGGGDSALDWTLNLQPLAKRLTLVHRRDEFRGAPDSVNKMRALVASGGMDLKIGQVTELEGADGQLTAASVKGKETVERIECDALLPFFGLTMKLGPVADWGLKMADELIPADTGTFETNVPGIFAIGDINTYPGKLKLILSGFHEAALMAQKAHHYVHPDKRLVFQYTTSSTSLQKKLGVA